MQSRRRDWLGAALTPQNQNYQIGTVIAYLLDLAYMMWSHCPSSPIVYTPYTYHRAIGSIQPDTHPKSGSPPVAHFI
jgi:hypothetical protein